MRGPAPRPADHGGAATRALVRRLAVEVFGAAATEEPIDGFELLTRTALDDPLAGVRAGRLVSDVAAGQMREWALTARGAGRSWDDVAAALDLAEGALEYDDGRALGEVAWEWLVEHRPPHPARHPFDRPSSAVWTCATCRARVRDTGPFESHPDDREHGHAPGCARHAAEVAAWRKRTGWDDGDPEDQPADEHIDDDEFEEEDR